MFLKALVVNVLVAKGDRRITQSFSEHNPGFGGDWRSMHFANADTHLARLSIFRYFNKNNSFTLTLMTMKMVQLDKTRNHTSFLNTLTPQPSVRNSELLSFLKNGRDSALFLLGQVVTGLAADKLDMVYRLFKGRGEMIIL